MQQEFKCKADIYNLLSVLKQRRRNSIVLIVQHNSVTFMVSGNPYLNDEKLYHI